jgi:hypothetical protein
MGDVRHPETPRRAASRPLAATSVDDEPSGTSQTGESEMYS